MSEFDMPEFQREDASRLPSGDFPDPWTTPIERVDVSDSRLFQQDAWRPYFERLRRDDPVHFTAESPFGPYWSVTKFDDIAYVERNHEIFSSFPTIAIGDSPTGEYIENFIAMDPPKHEQQRKTVQGVVAPRNLPLEPVIRATPPRFSTPCPTGEFDWVDAVSIELTTRMLATLFDFPFEDRRKLTTGRISPSARLSRRAWTRGPAEEVMAGLQDMAQTFMGLWAERAAADPSAARSHHHALAQRGQKDMVTAARISGNLMLLIVGGNDTTRNSISGGVLGLNQFPSEYAKLRNDPSVIPNMVSEIIRWQTPVLHMRRTLTVDHEYKGKQMKAGEKVVMWYISGNRDEDAHDDADRLIIDRPNARQHVSFGFGVHRCMGNRLAEMQLKVVWEEIQRRFHMVECVAPETRLKSNFIRNVLPGRLLTDDSLTEAPRRRRIADCACCIASSRGRVRCLPHRNGLWTRCRWPRRARGARHLHRQGAAGGQSADPSCRVRCRCTRALGHRRGCPRARRDACRGVLARAADACSGSERAGARDRARRPFFGRGAHARSSDCSGAHQGGWSAARCALGEPLGAPEAPRPLSTCCAPSTVGSRPFSMVVRRLWGWSPRWLICALRGCVSCVRAAYRERASRPLLVR